MPTFLIVEDSAVILKILKHICKQCLHHDVLFASSMADAVTLYEHHKEELTAGLIDLALPDAPNGELVEYLLQKRLPIVVLTGTSDKKTRAQLLKKGVADYVIKESRFSYQYAIQMLNRLHKNQQVEVLVVEDSATSRKYITQLLNLHRYQVHQARHGLEGLQILAKHPDIQLVITDYHMPEMDGFELVQAIRHKFEKRNIGIIGLSGQDNSELSIKFIKNGANDFLPKPFEHEEFFCRVTNNIEAQENLQKLHNQANRDYLTGLYNRRCFSEEGALLLKKSFQQQQPVSLAMLDIDYFKKINDEYGHASGDCVLLQLGEFLQTNLSRFLVARTGGEEFAILLPGLCSEQAFNLMDSIRLSLSQTMFDLPDDFIRITISVGICSSKDNIGSLEQFLDQADENLYQAKKAGRNMVIADE